MCVHDSALASVADCPSVNNTCNMIDLDVCAGSSSSWLTGGLHVLLCTGVPMRNRCVKREPSLGQTDEVFPVSLNIYICYLSVNLMKRQVATAHLLSKARWCVY